MKAGIVTIGDEILLGQIIDTNAVWLSKELANLGLDVSFILTVPDTKEDIERSIDMAFTQAEIVIMTGGLGPTKDDVTKKTIADYYKIPLEFDDILFQKISKYFDFRQIPVTELHENQCLMPKKCTQLENNMGTAPGMLFKNDKGWLISLPGVPYEMEWIFKNSFLPLLRSSYPQLGNIYFRTIRTAGMGETSIADKINDIAEEIPEGISLAYLPSLGHVKLRLTSKNNISQIPVVNDYVDKISARLGNLVYGYDDISLEETLKRDFVSKGLSLSTAESCTGGNLAHHLTSIAGSSSFFMGGLVTYSYQLKNQLLKVKNETLVEYGAVSENTVLEMLEGLLDSLKTDVGIAISGIAGPGGGTPTKPVGTIWLAWGNRNIQKTKKLQLTKDRLKNIQYTTNYAMNSLRLFLTELELD